MSTSRRSRTWWRERAIEPNATWHLIPAESKRYARVEVIETVIEEIEEGMRRHGMKPPTPIEE